MSALARSLVIVATTVVIVASTTAHAQVDWTRDPLTPVLPAGQPGEWDDELAGASTVTFHEGIYKMWYEGNGGFGYATSPDGLVWDKHAANPILEPGEPGRWDEQEINQPSVLSNARTKSLP